ncbi:alanine racemase [Bradyrhizobium sp. 13971]
MPIGLEANPYYELADAVRETSRSTMIIDLSAIESNYRKCQALAPRSACGAVVKADAYGLGATRIAPFLASLGCAHFFVADVEEGIALRDVLPSSARIYMLYGASPGMEVGGRAAQFVADSQQQGNNWRPGFGIADFAIARCQQEFMSTPACLDSGFSTDELHTIAENRNGRSEFPVVLLMSQLACAEWRKRDLSPAAKSVS